MVNTTENVAKKDGQYDLDYLLDSVGNGVCWSEGTKNDMVDGRMETNKRRMGMSIIARSTTSKLRTDSVKSR